MSSEETPVGKRLRGFAGMDPARHKEIASSAGKKAHAKGTAHEFDSSEARAAGRIGGNRVVEKHGREHMAKIGRRGGKARKGKGRGEPPKSQTPPTSTTDDLSMFLD